jgi:hypothetical protein
VVAFAEDHCYPDQHRAEALIAAHRGPWAADGPAMRNANYSKLSCALGTDQHNAAAAE